MRSLTSAQATDMEWLFWFSLMLTHLPLTESILSADTCLIQPRREIRRKSGQVVMLPCDASTHCSTKNCRFEWFVFKENSHLRLNLSASPNKYKLDQASLRIKSLNTSDSGIYHCAMACRGDPRTGAQHVGSGTVLTVTGHVKLLGKRILVWLSFVLLLIYSVAIVTLIFLKRYGCNMSRCGRMGNIDKKLSIKNTRFSNVLQEMNNRRNLNARKQTSCPSSSNVEAASAEINNSTDDIYQNVEGGGRGC